jgi:hypothetical protein
VFLHAPETDMKLVARPAMDVRRGLASFSLLAAAFMLPGTGAAQSWESMMRSAKLAVDHFDRLAPTVTAEDVLAYRSRLGKESEARRNASLKASRACMQGASVPGPPETAAVPPLPPARADLRSKSLMELARLYQERPDADVASAIQWKALNESGAIRSAPLPSGAAGAQSADLQMLGMLQQQGRAMQPKVQECLKAAEQHGNADEQVLDEYYAEGFDRAIDLLRRGRAAAVTVDFFSNLFSVPEKDGQTVPLKQPATGRLLRYNVVLGGGPYGRMAVPLKQASATSRKPDLEHWNDLPEYEPPAEPDRRKPSLQR